MPSQVELDDPIEGRAACHVAEAEWRVAGWLEREGIKHDIYAESQLEDETLVLDECLLRIIAHYIRNMYIDIYMQILHTNVA